MMIQWRKSQSAHYLHLSLRSLTHIHTHSSAYCSAQDVLSHSYIKLGSTYAGTLSQMYTVGGSAPPVVVQRCYRSCAEVKKRRAAHWGHSVGRVWRRHRKVSSGFFVASDLQQHRSRASWQTKLSSLLTCTWPRSPRPSSSTFGNISTVMVGFYFPSLEIKSLFLTLN